MTIAAPQLPQMQHVVLSLLLQWASVQVVTAISAEIAQQQSEIEVYYSGYCTG
jgi:hypothetical protein